MRCQPMYPMFSSKISCTPRPERCHSHKDFHGQLESEVPALYTTRYAAIAELLHAHESDVICLQELWFNPECVCVLNAADQSVFELDE